MVLQEEISLVIDSQKENFLEKNIGMAREDLDKVPHIDSFATIITGMRRCGKSTLLLQILRENEKESVFLNFEDIRLSGFTSDDFQRLHREIERRKAKIIFFDEIQIVKKWELFINQLLREGYNVVLTGSNASMLSKELGTHLTGRHLSMELFPFSYSEFLKFKNLKADEDSVLEYLQKGGIPEYLKTDYAPILNFLVDDILMKDIVVRHGVRDVSSLRQLTNYLITNIGNLVSANRLIGMFDVKTAATFLDYFSYLKDVYLLDFVPVFNHSLKVQARNPKKVYAMDMGIYSENSLSTSENWGRRMENLIFLHLRRNYSEIFYFKGKGECDFITMEKGKVKEVVQVCYQINDENFDRELDGLVEALEYTDQKSGSIVTFNQEDEIQKEGFQIKIIPAHKFMTQ